MKRSTSRGQRVKVKRAEGTLSVTRAHVAGIDLGSVEHYVACPPRDGQANVKTFGTTTPELAALADWLQAEGVVSVAMESTGGRCCQRIVTPRFAHREQRAGPDTGPSARSVRPSRRRSAPARWSSGGSKSCWWMPGN